MDEDMSDEEARAMRSVATFLDTEREKRRTVRRTWIALIGLVAGAGLLHGLTVAGQLPPEGREVVIASAGAMGLGLIARL